MKHISHNTRTLTIGGIINQDQLKIGTSTNPTVGIFFDNGNQNMPGIRFVKDDNEEYIFHFDTSTGIFNGVSWPTGEEAVFHRVTSVGGTDRDGWIATSSTGINLGLTGVLNVSSSWIIVRAYNPSQPNNGPIVASSVTNVTLPNLATWRAQSSGTQYSDVCTSEYIPPTQEWQYSTNGTDWFPVKGETPSLNYEEIDITPSSMDANGVVTIQHNLGKKYLLGLGYTVTPDTIDYVDENTLKLNYNSHNTSDFATKVWFLNSRKDMIVNPGQINTNTVSETNETGGEA